jgi:hypothetical protein
MKKFERYVAAFDGSKDWSEIQPLYEDAFDAECVFVTADGEYDKVQWAGMLKALVDKGAAVSGFEITAEDGPTVHYKLTVSVPGAEPVRMSSTGTLRDGRLVRVEPTGSEAITAMMQLGK